MQFSPQLRRTKNPRVPSSILGPATIFVSTPVKPTGFLFSPPRFTLKNSPAECPESYRSHPIRVKLLSCSDFSEACCACTAVALCEGVSPPIFDTARNLLPINASLLQYFCHFVPTNNPHQTRFEPQSFVFLYSSLKSRKNSDILRCPRFLG